MMEKTNKNFIAVSMMCIFLLTVMITFGSVTVGETYSASEVACYACTNNSSGKYVWGDYSGDSNCDKMISYTTKDSCLVNNCSSTEKLDSDGTCVDNSGLVTVNFKSGSLTVYRNTCTLKDGSCRISLPKYQNAIGWSEQADCSDIVETSTSFITFTKAQTYTYYACNEKSSGNTSSSSSSSKKSSSSNNIVVDDETTNDNPETGSAEMILVFLGGFLMVLYMCYVYRNSIKIDNTK